MTTEATEPSATTTQAGETIQTTATDPAAATTTTEAPKGADDAQTKIPDGEGKTDGSDKQPDAVVYDFKMPEGVEMDKNAAEQFKAIAAELKMPAESAQKVVDLYAKLQGEATKAFSDQVQAWGDEVKADKELGSTENLAAARKAVDDFGTPEFKSLLNSTGLGNHPEVVRFMSKIGKQISEDAIVRGRQAEKPRDAANVLYGSTT